MYTLKDLVKNQIAQFVCYRDGDLWYEVFVEECTTAGHGYVTKKSFQFPVPIKDTGTGVFPAQIKAIFLMRWIRKQLEAVKEHKTA